MNQVNSVKISKELSTNVEADDKIICSPIVIVERGNFQEENCVA
jgi:ABC-type transport system involved in Fe-S cluster assembly fused permease/ATPase subunit